jgi:hypothetical protein
MPDIKKYEKWSKSDLYNKGKEVGIEGRSKMKNNEQSGLEENHGQAILFGRIN